MDPLGALRQRIEAGDREGARRELAGILRTNPQSVAAWALLADLLEDPARQADCYRQILRLEPGNRQAAARLRALTGQAPVQEQGARAGDDETAQQPGERQVTALPSQRVVASPASAARPGHLGGLLHLLGVQGVSRQAPTGRGGTSPTQEPLSPDEVIQLAGGPLPPEERRHCPQCEAVIPKDAAKCAWCGTSLEDVEEH